jgi:hypothetical protein
VINVVPVARQTCVHTSGVDLLDHPVWSPADRSAGTVQELRTRRHSTLEPLHVVNVIRGPRAHTGEVPAAKLDSLDEARMRMSLVVSVPLQTFWQAGCEGMIGL